MARDKTENAIVARYGKLWTRVPANLKKLATKDLKKASGIYALYNGTMPVYIGHGKIFARLRGHNRSRKKDPFWEHFSWYETKLEGLNKEIESLFLNILPFYVHSLNKMGGKFVSGREIPQPQKHPLTCLGRRVALVRSVIV